MPMIVYIFQYAYSVGFGIAYPWAKAMREPVSGMNDEFRFPRFFMWILG